jgi:hypothetical protein
VVDDVQQRNVLIFLAQDEENLEKENDAKNTQLEQNKIQKM